MTNKPPDDLNRELDLGRDLWRPVLRVVCSEWISLMATYLYLCVCVNTVCGELSFMNADKI